MRPALMSQLSKHPTLCQNKQRVILQSTRQLWVSTEGGLVQALRAYKLCIMLRRLAGH